MSILSGLVCPLAGVYLVLRRMVFLGIALPQITSLGIATALTAHTLYGFHVEVHSGEDRILVYSGALGFTLVSILVLSFTGRQDRLATEPGLGAMYVFAMALSILILAQCPNAERGWLNLLKGELIAVSDSDLFFSIVGFGVILVCFLFFNREFTLISFDRELAKVFRKNVTLWDIFLLLLIGGIIGIAVISVGPLVAFGFAIIPPLIVKPFATSIRNYIIFSTLCGAVGSIIGFILSYKWDLPSGPTDIVFLGLIGGLSRLIKKFI